MSDDKPQQPDNADDKKPSAESQDQEKTNSDIESHAIDLSEASEFTLEAIDLDISEEETEEGGSEEGQADLEEDAGAADKGEEDAKHTPSSPLSRLIILVGGIVVVLAILITGGIWFFSGDDTLEKNDAAQTQKQAAEELKKINVPFYVEVVKDMLIDLQRVGENNHYVKLSITVMTYDKPLSENIQTYTPEVKNYLITYFADKSYDEIKQLRSNRVLSQKLYQIINKIVSDKKIEAKVEEVLITQFLME